MFILIFCAAVFIAKAWPRSATGRVLHRLLIDWPAETLAKLTPGGVVSALIALVGAAVVVSVAKGEGAFLVASGLPEAFAWFLAFDVATYIDAIAIVWLIATTVRMRASLAGLRARLAQALRLARLLGARATTRARDRTPRAARRPAHPPHSDDVEGLAFA